MRLDASLEGLFCLREFLGIVAVRLRGGWPMPRPPAEIPKLEGWKGWNLVKSIEIQFVSDVSFHGCSNDALMLNSHSLSFMSDNSLQLPRFPRPPQSRPDFKLIFAVWWIENPLLSATNVGLVTHWMSPSVSNNGPGWKFPNDGGQSTNPESALGGVEFISLAYNSHLSWVCWKNDKFCRVL